MTFYPLEKIAHLSDGYQKAFTIDRMELLLIQLEGHVHLIENTCPHMDVALTFATQLPDQQIRCKAHGIAFDLTSGKACGPLANTIACLKRFDVVYDGAIVGVEL